MISRMPACHYCPVTGCQLTPNSNMQHAIPPYMSVLQAGTVPLHQTHCGASTAHVFAFVEHAHALAHEKG